MLKKQKVALEYDKSTNAYFKEVKGFSPLTREEELSLWRKYKYEGDIKARNKLVSSNLKFVASIAKQYQGRGLSYSDLIAEGNVGLLKALDKFDGERGFKIISYSVWWIKQTIMEALSKRNASDDEDIPLDFENQLKGEEELPAYTDEDNFLDEPTSTDPLGAFTEDIGVLMGDLSKREQNIIEEYYGLGSKKPKTLEEIGKEYGLTKERIRQIRNAAFKKMRCAVLEHSITL